MIRKDEEMYYAFFARHWSGPIELRGSQDRTYHIVDYVNNKDWEAFTVLRPQFLLSSIRHLLLDARPE